MKIHNPEITGSLIFPRTDGTRVVIKLDSAGSLITDDQNSGGVSTGTKPSADFSGSFTGSFVGDGSNLTGVSATEFNIDALDALGGASVEQADTFLLSDAGTEKKLTFSNLEDSIFGNISGDVTIAAGGVSSIGTGVIVNTDVNNSAAIASSKINYNGTGIVSGSGQITLSSTTGFVADENIDHTSVSMIAGDGLTGGGDIATSRTFAVASGNNGITVNANDITLNTSSTTFTDGVKSKLNAETVISGSTFSSPSQGTLRATINGSNSDIDLGLQSADDVTFGSIVLSGDISGSSTSTGSFGRVEVNASTLAIGGVEINSTVASNIQTTSGTNTGDVTLGGSYNYLTLDSQVITLGQVDATSDISNLTTANVSEVTNLYYTDTRVKTKLTAENVHSGSAQVVSSLVSSTGISNGNKTTIQNNLGVDAAGTDNSTDVTLANTNYLSISGQEITGGTVPLGSGGTGATSAGAARTALGVDAAGTDNSTDVTLAGSYDYLSLSGQEITLGQVDYSTDIANTPTTITGAQITKLGHISVSQAVNLDTMESNISTNNSKVGYTDSLVKTKLNAETVISGSSQVNAQSATNPSAIYDNSGTPTLRSGITAAEVRTAIGVDGSGTDNSTDVTLGGSYDYITISGQTITRNQITNDDLAGSIANAKLSNSSVSYGGVSLSLGGSDATPAFDLSDATDYPSANITHDSTTGFVANEHIDHSSVTLTAGNGLTGGGTIASSRTFAVGAGTGVTVNANDVAIGQAVGTSDNVTFNDVTVSGDLTVSGTTTSINTTNLNVTDKLIEVNRGGSTAASADGGGLFISGANESITWDNGNSRFNISDDAHIVGNITVTGNVDGRDIASDGSKLDGIEASADVTDTANVTAAGALMDSEVDADIKTLSLPSNTTISAFGKTLVDDADAATARTTLGLGSMATLSSIDISSNTNLAAGTGITLSGDTLSIGQAVGTGDDVTFGTVRVDDTTASTSKTTGALIVDGGAGVNGDLNVGGDVVAYASSDERLKDNIELISNPIEKVQSLKGVTWNWNDDASETQKSTPNVGVIAQDVEKVLPQLVHDRDNGFKGVDYSKLTGLLIEAIKDQQKQIDELKSKLS